MIKKIYIYTCIFLFEGVREQTGPRLQQFIGIAFDYIRLQFINDFYLIILESSILSQAYVNKADPDCCPRCGKRVYFAEQKLALGRKWHVACFSCGQ